MAKSTNSNCLAQVSFAYTPERMVSISADLESRIALVYIFHHELVDRGVARGGCPWCSSTLLATEFLRKRLAKLTAEHTLTLPGQRSLL